MRRLAICCLEFAALTQRAIGVSPLTAPPMRAETFDLRIFRNVDFLYVDLHGHPTRDYWSNNAGEPVVYAHELAATNLAGVVVFATCCFLGDAHNPMRAALLQAGASAIIAGAGENYTLTRLSGAAELARRFLQARACGLPVGPALGAAKSIYRFGKRRDLVTLDTLAFKLFRPEAA